MSGTDKTLNRRNILKATGGTIGAAALATRMASSLNVDAQGDDRLVVSTALEMTNIDPNVNSGSQHISTLWLEGLVSIAEDGTVVPYLAEAWTISDDGLVYEFTIREGVTFHNGDPLTMDDIVFTIERTMDPDLGAPRRASLLDVEKVEAVDNRTVRLTLTQAFGPLLPSLAEVWIVPRSSANEDGTITEPIGTGPFVFESWTPNDQTVVMRNDNYWQDGMPHIDGITVKVITDDTTRMAALRAGEVDLMQGFPAPLLETVESDEFAIEPILDPSTWTLVFNLNSTPSPIDDIRVRQAIALAMNKEELLLSRIGSAGIGEVSKMPSSSGEYWYIEDFEDPFPAQDQNRAVELLEEAGYGDGLPSIILPATIETQKYAEVLAGQLNEVGIEAELDVVDRTAYRERYERFDWHIILNVTGPRTEPSAKYSSYYSGAAIEGMANPNLPEVDELYLEAIRVTDPEARRLIYGELWRVIQNDNVAAVSVWHDSNIYAFESRLTNFSPGRTFHLHSMDGGLAKANMTQ